MSRMCEIRNADLDGSTRPGVTFTSDGVAPRHHLRLHRGLRRLSRACRASRSPRKSAETYEKVYPFGWLGILSETPPVHHELIYANSERGFALCSMRNDHLSRYYVQCPTDDRVGDWSDDRLLERTAPAASRREFAANVADRPVDREKHRAAALLRLRADAIWPPVPLWRRGAYRAAHRRKGAQHCRVRCPLPLPGAEGEIPRQRRYANSPPIPPRRSPASGRPSVSAGG